MAITYTLLTDNGIKCSHFFPVVVLGDKCLGRIANCLPNVYFQLGLLLNLTRPIISQLELKFTGDLWRLNYEVMARWRDDNCHMPDMVKTLIQALRELDLNDVVEVVRNGESVGSFFNRYSLTKFAFSLPLIVVIEL